MEDGAVALPGVVAGVVAVVAEGDAAVVGEETRGKNPG